MGPLPFIIHMFHSTGDSFVTSSVNFECTAANGGCSANGEWNLFDELASSWQRFTWRSCPKGRALLRKPKVPFSGRERWACPWNDGTRL